MLDLDPIKKRLAAATPGPWEPEQYRDEDPDPLHHNVSEGCWAVGKGDMSICDVNDGPDEDNARFIAAAPTDVAALVAEVERLRALLDEVAELGDVSHGEDDDCPAGQYDDEDHESGCHIAHHNEVMDRVRAAVKPACP